MNFCHVCGKPKVVGRCEHCAEKERHRIATMIAERQAVVANQVESERRLSRYDEAKQLIEQFVARGCALDVMLRANAFLKSEPKGSAE